MAIPKPRLSKPVNPHSSIIAFDIHGVLFKADWKKIAQMMWADKKTYRLCIYLFNPWFIYDLVRLSNKGAVLEACITFLSSKYRHFAQHEDFIILAANTQKPIFAMVNILHFLKNQGYVLHIFSNIGSSLYEDLSIQFPHIFTLFDDAFTPNGFDGKSHQKTFIQYLKEFNPDNKQVLFVDNNKNNIIMANTVGIVSVYYKNPRQLRTTFKELRII